MRCVLVCGLTSFSFLIPPSLEAAKPRSEDDPPLALDDPDRYRRPWNETHPASRRAARALFLAGAAWDAYTTKRGLEAGLEEGNPFAAPLSDRADFAGVVLSKALVWFAFEMVGQRGHPKARDTLFASTGVLQLGVGFANQHLIHEARAEQTGVP
jgi:hypothetical protein